MNELHINIHSETKCILNSDSDKIMDTHINSDTIIEALGLIEHPEGGFYKETYRSGNSFSNGVDDSEFPTGRSFSTSIYFLLKSDQTSAFHRIKSDELWHFHLGSPLTIHIIHPDSLYEALYLGPDLHTDQQFQHVVPAGSWFGVSIDKPNSFTLSGCTVSPGFDFRDFEMGDPYMLKQAFPEHKEIINKLSGS